jgi:glycosyltransferase involved in cell wall biosynthesis
MIFKIAEPPPGGKGLLGISPDWDGSPELDADTLRRARGNYFTALFTRNYFSQFFERISPALSQYGALVDIVCGWDTEKIRMYFQSINPAVEVLQLSAMNFDTFDLLDRARQAASGQGKYSDLFFAISDRPDGLKNIPLLLEVCAKIDRPTRMCGYGRLHESVLEQIRQNPRIQLDWHSKADVADPTQRLTFLQDLAASRGLLVTSTHEGYARLIGEALYLGVPILLNAAIQCENWIHLNQRNCVLFDRSTFPAALSRLSSQSWEIDPPIYEDGNTCLRKFFMDYLARRGCPPPEVWYPLGYGARNENIYTGETE